MQELKIFLKEALLNLEKGKSFSMVIPFGVIKKILEENNFIHLSDDWEQNGWQVDYWTKFEKNGSIYSVSGSLYYGDFNIEKQNE